MKKLTPVAKQWLVNRARREARRHGDRRPGVMSERRRAARTRFQEDRRLLPAATLRFDERPGCCVIKPPKSLDLVLNYDETLGFLMDIRGHALKRAPTHPENGSKLKLFMDFGVLENLTPGAGLILAAELDRRRLATGRRPTAWDDEWHPAVRTYFDQGGLFELLGITPKLPSEECDDDAPLRAVKFIRGRSVRGQLGSALRDKLEALCGKKIGPRLTVYEAISEAIANTRHAYPRDVSIWPTKATGRWWAGGTWNSATGVVSLQIYDQGVGIPATLPRSDHWSDIIRLVGLGNRLHPERDDHNLIEAALKVGRTSTGESGRGKGLAEMASWIDKLGNGFLRITSGRGSVMYRPGGNVTGTSQKAPLFGTLIEWEIGLGG